MSEVQTTKVKILAKIREKIKKYGWKAVAGIFIYYLVRDVTLYIILPYFLFVK